MIKEQCVKLTLYNLWANERISQCILNLEEEQTDREILSSFPSIRKTLYHIWDAESIWLKRLNGESLSTWPSKDFKGSISEAKENFIKSSAAFSLFSQSKNEDFFLSEINYTSIKGEEFKSQVSDIITHCMNHSTFHRGQLVSMLRQVGYTALPVTDYIAFVRSSKD